MGLSNLFRVDLSQVENLLGVIVTVAGLVESAVGTQTQLGIVVALVATLAVLARNAVQDFVAARIAIAHASQPVQVAVTSVQPPTSGNSAN